MGQIQKLIWDKFIEGYLSFGKRWILLIPFLLIPVLFGFVKLIFALPNFQTTITNSYFVIPSAAIILISLIAYWVQTGRPPPEDHFAVAVAKFHTASEDEKKEASNLQYKINRAIKERMSENGLEGSSKCLSETIDPQAEDADKRAGLLARHYRAHAVVYGFVMYDEDYEFEPLIFQQGSHPYRFSPRGDTTLSESVIEVPDRHSLKQFKKQKVDEVTDLATFMCGMARINEYEYAEAEKVLGTIARPSAEVLFYRGFALLELDEFERARQCFVRADEARPDFYYALLYASFALNKLGENELADRYSKRASAVAKREGASEDVYLMADAATRIFEDLAERQAAFLDEADEQVGKMLKTLEATEHHVNGIKRLDADDHEGAVEALDRAIDLCPDDGNAWALKGLALAKLERPDQAREAVRLGTELDGAPYNLAQAYAALGDKNNALAHLSGRD